MAIQAGQRLGPYEILSAIGAGGMGEVYRARDTRLERIVAVKILPDHLSDRAELRERFEREARTIASLNHPHICTLHDIGLQDGTDFLVMEYLEGETLAERLKKGPLPLDQVLRYAIEISDALDKAHHKGITHRDLKPGNIMLTKSGTKLLDFGLAKLKKDTAPANVTLSKIPTENAVTAQGTILGTLQYMAPEQLEVKEADARTDIFAFGVVVYEMATGRKAFDGKTSASVVAKILETDPPPISSLQPMTPATLDRVVKKCLAKEPEKRWQDASDLCDELKWIAEGSSQIALVPAAAVKGIRALGRRALLLSLGALLLGAVIASMAVWNLKPSPPPRAITRFTITLPAGQRLAGLDEPAVALSPDGTRLAYIAAQGAGIPQVYLRAMDSPEVKPIQGTEGAAALFFSPDSQWLAFFAGGKLKKVSVNGGAAVILCDAPRSSNVYGASWGVDDAIVFHSDLRSGIFWVPAAGGTPQRLTTPKSGETFLAFPEILPGGKALLSQAGGSPSGSRVVVHSQQTGERRDVIGGTRPSYAPTGHLIYMQAGTLMAVPFDPQRLGLTGSPVPMLEGVLRSTDSGVAQYSFSSTGTLVYVSGTETAQTKPVLVSRNGTEQPLAVPARDYGTPQFSPDGRRIAFAITEGEDQIWLYDVAKESLSKFTVEGTNSRPLWTPDGKQIAFNSTLKAGRSIFWQRADGSGGLEQLTTSESGPHFPVSFSPDGQWLAFVENNPTTKTDIWLLRLSDRKLQPFLRTRFNETRPLFSPDGHWLAYMSDESGSYEIYVQPFPGPGGKYQVSSEGGAEPVWNPNGRELFYRSGDKMMVVDVMTQPSFSTSKPRMLFEGGYLAGSAVRSYDVSPEGQRFLMLKAVQLGQATTQINVVLNWFEELKQKVPAGKK